jgi:hypothetical protein
MSPQEKKMKPLDDEIERLDAEIARLQAERSAFVRAKAMLLAAAGVIAPIASPTEPTIRKRAANIKPLIIDIMSAAGDKGATSAEVTALVKSRVPAVAKDTVGSILSRLKSDGAFAHDGERYYDSKYAPKSDKLPFEPLRAVG